MRHVSIVIERMETTDSGFDALYRRYARRCAKQGVEPMRPSELLELLKALTLAEEATGEEVPVH